LADELRLRGAWSGKMPVARYFLYVGGALLALLFISDAYLPKLPAVNTARADPPVIRIHIQSDRRWPERIDYDTGLPTKTSPQIADADSRATVPATINDLPAKAEAREAFAQLKPSGPTKPEPKPQLKRKVAKHRATPGILIAQRPQLGWFGRSYW
jgi:hypothetical protein